MHVLRRIMRAVVYTLATMALARALLLALGFARVSYGYATRERVHPCDKYPKMLDCGAVLVPYWGMTYGQVAAGFWRQALHDALFLLVPADR